MDEIELLKRTLEALAMQHHTLQTSVRRGAKETVGKEGKRGKREVAEDLARQGAELDDRRAKLVVLERKMARQLHDVLLVKRENNGLVEQVLALKNQVHAAAPRQQSEQWQQRQQQQQQHQLFDAFHRCHAQLAHALEIIWLCVGRNDDNGATVAEFQTIRNNSVRRRDLFATGGNGHNWRNAVELERNDLKRAVEGKMEVGWWWWYWYWYWCWWYQYQPVFSSYILTTYVSPSLLFYMYSSPT